MKVVAFNGSPRPKGNTRTMLDAVCRVLNSEGIETEIVQVGGKAIRGCSECYICKDRQETRCSIDKDHLNEWLEKMLAADGILLGSPTFFTGVTSEMKALIDRAGFVARSNNCLLKRKVGAAVVAVRRGGAIHAFDSMNHFFTIQQMIVPGSSYWNDGVAGREQGEVAGDEEGMQIMTTLGENMAWLLKKLA
jgi:multimeric flavodoxin WrbA